MSAIENPPAFPNHPAIQIDEGGPDAWHGMSLRDWFAGQALVGFLTDGSQRLVAKAVEDSPEGALIQDALAKASVVNEQVALGCYALADAMLFARSTFNDADNRREEGK